MDWIFKMSVKMEELREYAKKVAKGENCILYDIQMTGSHSKPILRIFIDKEGKQGVSIDDCSQVSRGLDLILDREDLVSDRAYHLEVSSPGLDRHLSESWHFKKAIGEKIHIRLKTNPEVVTLHPEKGDGKRKKLTGQLLKADESSIELAPDDKRGQDPGSVMIPYKSIDRARVIFCYTTNNFNRKKSKKRKD